MSSLGEHVEWEYKKFIKEFILWLLCIPINFVPVFVVNVNRINEDEYKTAKDLFISTISDIDFMFVFLSVLFVLPVHGLFADYCNKSIQDAGKTCSFACYICSFFLIIVYLFCTLKPEVHALLYAEYSKTFNIIILALTILAGIAIYSLTSISTRKESSGEDKK